jgi:hypothetical protein
MLVRFGSQAFLSWVFLCLYILVFSILAVFFALTGAVWVYRFAKGRRVL